MSDSSDKSQDEEENKDEGEKNENREESKRKVKKKKKKKKNGERGIRNGTCIYIILILLCMLALCCGIIWIQGGIIYGKKFITVKKGKLKMMNVCIRCGSGRKKKKNKKKKTQRTKPQKKTSPPPYPRDCPKKVSLLAAQSILNETGRKKIDTFFKKKKFPIFAIPIFRIGENGDIVSKKKGSSAIAIHSHPNPMVAFNPCFRSWGLQSLNVNESTTSKSKKKMKMKMKMKIKKRKTSILLEFSRLIEDPNHNFHMVRVSQWFDYIYSIQIQRIFEEVFGTETMNTVLYKNSYPMDNTTRDHLLCFFLV